MCGDEWAEAPEWRKKKVRRISYGVSLGVLFLAVTVACAQAPVDPAPVAEESKVVAKFGGESITEAELMEEVAGELFKIRQEMYSIKSKGLKDMIFERLIDAAAEAAGVNREAYLKENVDAKVEVPTNEEIERTIKQYRARLPEDDAQAREQVTRYLTSQKQRAALESLRNQLMAASEVEILLDPPRVKVEPRPGNPSRGSEDALVTLIEFTDFECPYCGRVQGTLSQVMSRYEGKIRHVFMNLPLAMHANARLAAEASLCAGDQGRFWEMHDWMFQNQRSLQREHLIAQAKVLELNEQLFTECLDSNTHAAVVEADMVDAASAGITGTPGFLINGRVLGGAQPAQAFIEVIDEELRRAGVEPPKVEEPKSTQEAQEEAEAE
jgi:protein-disulfide isomerase